VYLKVYDVSLFTFPSLTRIYKALTFCPVNEAVLFRMEAFGRQVDGVEQVLT
jgi:hypothetical protein